MSVQLSIIQNAATTAYLSHNGSNVIMHYDNNSLGEQSNTMAINYAER